MATHTYTTVVTWTGDRGSGTSGYRDYGRDHVISADGPPSIPGSSDPTFRGDRDRWNPEQLLLASLSQCHMLQYLHFCADAGIIVTDYVDEASGTMVTRANNGRFTGAVLAPRVTVTSADVVEKALALHDDAHHACFIANSVNFPVRHEPTILVAPR
ncbi:OsmC family protein [Luedemannella flava]|uniref:OsmC family protein n=1 Tax=Luedemannella flava TaxID=349316 RepID=A0ABP4YH44_9ACTN